jgi:5-hydroxyisourate hydrolase
MTDARQGAAGRLTTHVLDTMSGEPGANLAIELFRLQGEQRERVAGIRTNHDGRAPAPLLQGTDPQPGEYELVFHVGDYFRARGVSLPEPAFLERVPVRVGIADPARHYHVPLLISPFGYSTSRGS